jgi:hypothetical protein
MISYFSPRRSAAVSEVAHAPSHLSVDGVAGCRPERRRGRVVVGNQGCDTACAERAQVVLAGFDELGGDGVAAVARVDGEAVHVAAPAIPCGDERPGDHAVDVRDQQ